MGMRIFDHTKQYVCTEVHTLEGLQEIVPILEEVEAELNDEGELSYSSSVYVAIKQINEFITNLVEQEKANGKTA